PVDEARVLAGPAGTPALRSVVAPQPEGLPGPGRPASHGGGGPQTQLPKDFFPRAATPGAPSPAQVGTPVPIGERAEHGEGWFPKAVELAEGAHRGESAGKLLSRDEDEGPVTERVYPTYEAPPGTHEDLERLTGDIHRTLAARARAEQDRDHAGRVADAARQQGLSVAQARDDIAGTLSATQAHQGAVQQHQQANERSAAQHQEGGAKVQDAGSRLAGVATLETLLTGWSGFTGVVLKFSSVLPDRAVNAFQKMNADSTQFMVKLAHIKGEVAAQQGEQPARGTQIAQTGARITTTGARADGTQAGLVRSQERGAEL